MMFQFSIAPTMTPGVDAEMAEIVADAVRVIRASGLPNETNAMSTTIEGEWDECMAVIKAACEAVQKHSPRVGLFLKADIRPSETNGLENKMRALEAALAKSEAAKSEAAKSEAAKSEAAKSEAAKSEAAESETTKADDR